MSGIYYGVDVSSNNYSVPWKTLKEKHNINRAMLRAGFGQGTADTRIIENINECKNNGIKYGFYWFSYALSTEDAKKEADYCCEYADKYGCDIGIAYDWEYDSENYATKMGVTITDSKRVAFAKAFLDRIAERGYRPILYDNIDYLVNHNLKSLLDKYDLWLAEWGSNSPDYPCLIWQYNVLKLGNLGEFDMNIFYDDTGVKDIKSEIVTYIKKEQFPMYLKKAFEVIEGKYGSGTQRRDKIRKLGYDYEMVQTLVNYILDSEDYLCNYFIEKQYENYYKKATEIKGSYNSETKRKLNEKGYDYEICRELAKLI